MLALRNAALAALMAGCFAACSGQTLRPHAAAAGQIATPLWVEGERPGGDTWCGLGVAGAAYDADSPYPKALSQARAVNNLAGSLRTHMQQAYMDRQTLSANVVHVERVLQVDKTLRDQVTAMARVEFWLDVEGVGPYGEPNFTYAHACLPAHALTAWGLDLQPVAALLIQASVDAPPAWLSLNGRQPGGRLCAVGYARPTFFAEESFETVTDDVRSQLSEVVQTFVGSTCQEVAREGGTWIEQITAASSEAVAKGVIITHFWHDRSGTGPNKTPQTTYGWGCVYPVEVLQSALSAVEKTATPAARSKIAQVRQHAADAFGQADAAAAAHAVATDSTPQ